jgi:hypothetical protein
MKITGKLSSEYKTYAREISQGNVISATALNVVSASPHHYPKTTGARAPRASPKWDMRANKSDQYGALGCGGCGKAIRGAHQVALTSG